MKHREHHGHHPMTEHHGSMQEHLRHESSRHAMYRHEEDKPSVPGHGHQEGGMGVSSFKGEAQDIAFGQASRQGLMSDAKKESAQFKNYHWDSDTGGASGY